MAVRQLEYEDQNPFDVGKKQQVASFVCKECGNPTTFDSECLKYAKCVGKKTLLQMPQVTSLQTYVGLKIGGARLRTNAWAN